MHLLYQLSYKLQVTTLKKYFLSNNNRGKISVYFFNPTALACTLPKDVGACKSKVDRWYFDNISAKCERFSYSGCEGNYNNFKSLDECQRICGEYGSKYRIYNPRSIYTKTHLIPLEELAANRTSQKRQLDVKVSGVLTYNVQNDEIHQNCGMIYFTQHTFLF